MYNSCWCVLLCFRLPDSIYLLRMSSGRSCYTMRATTPAAAGATQIFFWYTSQKLSALVQRMCRVCAACSASSRCWDVICMQGRSLVLLHCSASCKSHGRHSCLVPGLPGLQQTPVPAAIAGPCEMLLLHNQLEEATVSFSLVYPCTTPTTRSPHIFCRCQGCPGCCSPRWRRFSVICQLYW